MYSEYTIMHIVCCQLNTVWEDKPASFARAEALLRDAAIVPGSLVLLPEMFATGFSLDVAKIADDADGATTQFLARMAKDLGIYLMGGLVTTAPDGRGRNEAALFGPDGSELARYCKMHPFSFGGETKRYGCGDTPIVFDWHGVTVAPFICYDLRFPEVFRSALLRGTQIYTVIANWPAAREAHWIALLKARAIENQAYVAAVNRCGDDPKLHYSGHSLIIDPRGEVLADAGNGEGIISAEIDLDALLAYRRDFPAIDDIHREYIHSME
jgi:omega-amidase